MKNAISGRATTDLPALYDELESKIRALESLGRTREKYGDFLNPLAESCLPEEILIAWERHRNLNEASDGTRSLEQLLNFLNKEVRGKELIEFARSGFASGSYFGHRVDTWERWTWKVRVKTQYSTLVRPIQRILPLEVSGSDFQKQLGPPADSSMEIFVNDVNLPQVSRFGHKIKRPNRLNFSYKIDRSEWNQQTVILMKKTLLERLQIIEHTNKAIIHLKRCNGATIYANFDGSYGYFGEIFAKIRFQLMYTEYVINIVHDMITTRERIADAAEAEQYPCTREQINIIAEWYQEAKGCTERVMSIIERYFWEYIERELNL
ncbi:hypothetical protein HNY73_011294 [Argiope bruennichi]|uniref:Uncharacterized protein n=1 Tax=Argiope bruennichi TaxID=94029 RepID=A0A8T0F8P1_ARGBR|nr:hypothetical protein HNY73_011294 [Argiope bruennichi]